VKHVPGWFPGAGFHKIAEGGKKDLDESMYLTLEHVKSSMVRRAFLWARPLIDNVEKNEPATASSVVGTALENISEYTKQGIDEDVVRGAGATAYFAGTDTVIYLRAATSLRGITDLRLDQFPYPHFFRDDDPPFRSGR